MKPTSFYFVSLIVSASLLLTACNGAGSSSGAATKIVKIATQSPLSGDMAVAGTDIRRGAELGLEQMSASLGKMGFKVELVPFDDQGLPEIGVLNAKQIISDPAILCGIGHYNSGVFLPASEEYHRAGLAFVSSANTNPKVTTRGYLEVNRIVGRDDIQGVVGANFAAAQGLKRAFILHDKTTYGQEIAEFFKQEAEAKGLRVLGYEGTTEKLNFDMLLTSILAANPDVIYFGGMAAQSAVLFKQAREKGYQGMFLSDDGFDSSAAAKLGGPALLEGAGTFYSTVAGPAAVYPGTTRFVADFKAKYKSDPQPYAAQSYDAMGICLKGIEAAAQAQNGAIPTRAEVAQAIRAVKDYPGITGNLTFNAIGDPVVAKYFMMKVGTADPNQWSTNPIVETLDIAPPAP